MSSVPESCSNQKKKMPKLPLFSLIRLWLMFGQLLTIFINQSCWCVYIYGLVLHNPIPDDLGLKHHHQQQQHNPANQQPLLHRQHSQHSSSSSSFKYEDDDPLQSFKQNNALNVREPLRIRCKQDSDCIDDDGPDNEQMMYCDQHYGYCDYFRQIGELCRYDSQCDNGLICMFGRCEKPFKPGQRGARCNDSSDCGQGLCCARQHGERICKPKLKHGQQCFVPLGGLDYSLNELCPCDQGLECRTVSTKGKNLKKKRKNENVPRCSLTSPLVGDERPPNDHSTSNAAAAAAPPPLSPSSEALV